MAELISSTFTSWKLSERELLEGSVLNTFQKYVIQNEISTCAEQTLALEFDPLNPAKFAQDDAFLKGQLAALKFMLLRSEESEVALKNLSQASSQSET